MTNGTVTNQMADEVVHTDEHEKSFNFEEHRRTAVEKYLRIRSDYEAIAQAVREILGPSLKGEEYPSKFYRGSCKRARELWCQS